MANYFVSMEQLNVFVAVVENKSMKLAAEKINKTQSALSQSVRQLETQLGVILFDRTGYRLSLTKQGEVIHQKALKLLENQKELLLAAKHFSAGEEDQVIFSIEASFHLPSILGELSRCQSQFPSTQIMLRQEYLSGALTSVKDNRADLAISPMAAGIPDSGQFEIKELGQGCMITVASGDFVKKFKRLNSAKQLINEYQVLVQDTGDSTEGRTFGVQTGQRHWYVNDFNTKLMLIEYGMGWGAMPDHYVQNGLSTGKLIALELNDYQCVMNFDYCLMKSRNKILGPVAEFLWNSLSNLFKQRT